MSGLIADDLGAHMEINAIRFDPLTRTLSVAGRRSESVFDISLLKDALRLAREVHEPFFSLDPASPVDWDRSLLVAMEQLDQKYGQSNAGMREMVRRMREAGTLLPGGEVYTASLEDLDRDIWQAVSQETDLRVKLVFSPTWIGTTRLGWILYEADLAIKSVCAGFLESETRVTAADVWSIPGFDPLWLHAHGFAGRANFELAPLPSTVAANSNALDLQDIKPRLVIVHRKPGTSEDMPPCDRCNTISDHFSEHWREYASCVPAIGELMGVFRAYVAARFMIQRHPGLVEFVDGLDPPPTEESPPLYRRGPIVVRGRIVSDRFSPLGPDRAAYWHLAGGYGGGVSIGASAIRTVTTVNPPSRWEGETFGGAPGSGVAVRATTDGMSLELILSRTTLTVSRQRTLWATLLGVVLFLTVCGMFVRPMLHHSPDVCADCDIFYRRLEIGARLADVVPMATMIFLLCLPGAIAWSACEPTTEQAIAYLLLIAGGLLVLRLPFQTFKAWFPGSSTPIQFLGGPLTSLAAGARGSILLVGGWLLVFGINPHAVSRQLTACLGPDIAEPLLMGMESLDLMITSILVAVAATALSLLCRHMIPFLFVRIQNHRHSSQTIAPTPVRDKGNEND